MTDKEISRATINAFVARCINRGAVMAIDAEFGLRVEGAAILEEGDIGIRIDGRVCLVEITILPLHQKDRVDARR